MVKKQEYARGRSTVLPFILLVLTAFIMPSMRVSLAAEDGVSVASEDSICVAAEDDVSVALDDGLSVASEDETSATGEGGIYNVFPNAPIMKQASPPTAASISGLRYDTNTRTVTLSGAKVQGTLQFNSAQNQTDDKMITADYTIVLSPGTKSSVYALKLMDEVQVTIKGEGELVVQAPNKNTDYGAALTFNDTFKKAAPKLIIAGGTVTVDSTHHGFTIKEAGCLYIKEGAKTVKFIGKTETDGTKLSVIPSKDKLEGNESVPNVFSDIPCQAQYVPYVNGGKKVVISPNGTSSGSGDKTLSDTSLLRDDDKYYILTFKPGYTATWVNSDAKRTVLEKDNVFYWPGQTPEYNGDTPTKAADSKYTYTFSKWSPTPAAIYKNTTYRAVYTRKAKIKAPTIKKVKANKCKVTVTWNKIKKNKKGKKLLKKIKRIQVQYSTNRKFKKNVVSKKVGKSKTQVKLKLRRKKVYYIRVRYVAKDGSFSNWSKVKRVKIK